MTDLTLPYEATVSIAGPAFNIHNQGTGHAIVANSDAWDGVGGYSSSPQHAGGSFRNYGGGIGVWAMGTPAGYFQGNVHVDGTIDTTVGLKFPDGSVQTSAFAGPPGPMGPTGPQGPAGPPGPQGAGIPQQVILTTNQGGGAVELADPSGQKTVVLASVVGSAESGTIYVTDSTGAAANVVKAGMAVVNGNGEVVVNDARNITRAAMSINQSGQGAVYVNDASNITRAVMTIDANGGAFAVNDAANVSRVAILIQPNGAPAVRVNDAGGNPKAALFFDPSTGHGVVQCDVIQTTQVKSFRVPNPRQADTDIVYACIEGPEAAAYVRGTAHLIAGRCTIALPDHFVSVASPDNITVQLTPLSSDSLGLAVVSKGVDSIEVTELHRGTGNYDIDWEVKSVRRGFERYQVVRPQVAMASPPHPHLD